MEAVCATYFKDGTFMSMFPKDMMYLESLGLLEALKWDIAMKAYNAQED